MEQLEDKFVAGEWIPPFLQPSPTQTPTPTAPTRKRKQQITPQKHKRERKSKHNIPLTCKYQNKLCFVDIIEVTAVKKTNISQVNSDKDNAIASHDNSSHDNSSQTNSDKTIAIVSQPNSETNTDQQGFAIPSTSQANTTEVRPQQVNNSVSQLIAISNS